MNLELFLQEDLEKLLSLRSGEEKIGEKVYLGGDYMLEGLEDCPAKFVLLGIPEDIGPRANCGRGGADTAWLPFLKKLLNQQENSFASGSNILLLGNIDCSPLLNAGENELEKLRKAVEKIDELVSDLLCIIVDSGKIPILIGGGHNNAYGAIKGTSLALKEKISVINLDPHADFRPLEGRHSGNGFSYAKHENLLANYHVLGLHEGYNSEAMLQDLKNQGCTYTSFESIFIRRELSFEKAVQNALEQVSASPYGVELDMDSIENFPSSAQSPSGISSREARYYVHEMARSKNAKYLHLPEAAPALVPGSEDQVGKLLAYLVMDFIKSHLAG